MVSKIKTVAEGIIICQDEPPSAIANRRQTMALERYILHVIQVASETELDGIFTDPVTNLVIEEPVFIGGRVFENDTILETSYKAR